jgi:hypothetical protein
LRFPAPTRLRRLAKRQRIKEAETIRFQRRHEEAVESVMRAGEESWMAHAWYLERVLPNLYALRNVNRSEALTDQPIGDRIDESQLRRYSELMEHFRKETKQNLHPFRRQKRLASEWESLVYRLTYNDDVAAGQLAVFQGASDEHI